MNIFPTPRKLFEVQATMPEFYLRDFLPLPKQAITLISASGGSGKSFLCLQLAMRLINSGEAKRVLLWLSEDPAGVSRYRACELLKEVEGISIGDNDFTGLDVIDEPPTDSNFLNPKFSENLKDYDVVFIDPLIAFFRGDENNNSQARLFMNMINRAAKENNQTFVVVHHSTKPMKDQESRTRGASAFIDAVRLCYELRTPDVNAENTPWLRDIYAVKDNFGAGQFLQGNSEKGRYAVIQVLPFSTAKRYAEIKTKKRARDLV